MNILDWLHQEVHYGIHDAIIGMIFVVLLGMSVLAINRMRKNNDLPPLRKAWPFK